MRVLKYVALLSIALSFVMHLEAMSTSASNVIASFCASVQLPFAPALLVVGARKYSKQSNAHHTKSMQAAVIALARDLAQLRRYNDFYRGHAPEEDASFCKHGLLSMEDFAHYVAKTNLAYANVCEGIKGRYKSDSRLFTRQLNRQLQQIHVTKKDVVEELNLAASILEHYRLIHGQNVLAQEIEKVKDNQSRILQELERVQEKLSGSSQALPGVSHAPSFLPPQIENLIERFMASNKNGKPYEGGR